MIDAEMYGMIPSANTENRLSAPPEKRLRHRVRIDSGHRDVGADAEHHERQQQKHKTALQVAVLVGLTSLH